MKQRTPKILFCAPSGSNNGGITIWSKNVINYFNSNDSDVDFVHFKLDRSVSLTHLMPLYKRLFYAIKDYGLFPFKLFKTLNNKNYTVAHIASVGGWMGSIRDLLFVVICNVCNVKSIIHYHCGTIPNYAKINDWKWKLQNFVISKASKIIVLDVNSFETLRNIGYSHIYKVPNPLPIELHERVESKNRADNSILFVGHIVPGKGIFEFLSAVKHLDNLDINIYGPQNDSVINKIKEEYQDDKFYKRIVFHGLQPSNEVYNKMREATLFVLPTYSEGFPLVIMEAMACGCPIITTPVGAIKEMLTYNGEVEGYLVPPRNVEKLKETIIYCLEHKNEISQKASMAQEKVYTTYTMEIVMRQLVNIWIS